MTAAELVAYFDELEKASERPQREPPGRDLIDTGNLHLWHLVEQHADSGLTVIKEPVSEWPDDRQQDFTTIAVTRQWVRARRQRNKSIWARVVAFGDAEREKDIAKARAGRQ